MGMKYGQAGVDAVAPGLEEMARLVAQQDRHQRGGIDQALPSPGSPATRLSRAAQDWPSGADLRQEKEYQYPAQSVLAQVSDKEDRRETNGSPTCQQPGRSAAPAGSGTSSAAQIGGSSQPCWSIANVVWRVAFHNLEILLRVPRSAKPPSQGDRHLLPERSTFERGTSSRGSSHTRCLSPFHGSRTRRRMWFSPGTRRQVALPYCSRSRM